MTPPAWRGLLLLLANATLSGCVGDREPLGYDSGTSGCGETTEEVSVDDARLGTSPAQAGAALAGEAWVATWFDGRTTDATFSVEWTATEATHVHRDNPDCGSADTVLMPATLAFATADGDIESLRVDGQIEVYSYTFRFQAWGIEPSQLPGVDLPAAMEASMPDEPGTFEPSAVTFLVYVDTLAVEVHGLKTTPNTSQSVSGPVLDATAP